MRIRPIVALLLIFAAASAASGQSTDENAARAAEQAGRYREALTQYTAALQAAAEGSADEQRLREAILLVARRVSPRPALPEEAERRMARGQAAVAAATDREGYARAAAEYRQAISAAPWLADAYFNLGVVLDKAGLHAEAMRNLKLYLVAEPGAAEAKQARNLIYQIEFRQEEAQRAAASGQRAKDEERQRMQDVQRLAGTWEAQVTGKVLLVYEVEASGNDVEMRIRGWYQTDGRYRTQAPHWDAYLFRGKVSGQTISGNVSVDYSRYYEGGSAQTIPFTGTISASGDRISIAPFTVPRFPMGGFRYEGRTDTFRDNGAQWSPREISAVFTRK